MMNETELLLISKALKILLQKTCKDEGKMQEKSESLFPSLIPAKCTVKLERSQFTSTKGKILSLALRYR